MLRSSFEYGTEAPAEYPLEPYYTTSARRMERRQRLGISKQKLQLVLRVLSALPRRATPVRSRLRNPVKVFEAAGGTLLWVVQCLVAAQWKEGSPSASNTRLYLVFARGKELRFLSHFDMMRLWERALRRAAIPLRYTEGFHPRPRLSLALPLAVGMTADKEWLELELCDRLSPAEVCRTVERQLPAGMTLRWVGEAPWKGPSLTSQIRGAEYEVEVCPPAPLDRARDMVRRWQEAASWPAEERHRGKVRSLDLRQQVEGVELGEWGEERGVLRLRLAFGPTGSVRLDTVVREMEMGNPVRYHRRQLIFRSPPRVEGKEVECGDERRSQDSGLG